MYDGPYKKGDVVEVIGIGAVRLTQRYDARCRLTDDTPQAGGYWGGWAEGAEFRVFADAAILRRAQDWKLPAADYQTPHYFAD